jgi:hypothetical protein
MSPDDLCECGHPRKMHRATFGPCEMWGCRCKKFKLARRA